MVHARKLLLYQYVVGLTDCRSFTPEEAALWEESAQYAYRSFRDKAAASRNMAVEDMQVGRVFGIGARLGELCCCCTLGKTKSGDSLSCVTGRHDGALERLLVCQLVRY